MIKSEAHKVLFVHNQKAAGTSVAKYFRNNLPDAEEFLPMHAYARNAVEIMGKDAWDKYYSFGFVRNPWDRLVSWYKMISERPNENRENKLWQYVRNNSNSFSDFIKNCTETISYEKMGINYEKSFVLPQLHYFTNLEGEVIVDFIGKFETLHQDFSTVLNVNKLPGSPLSHENQTQKTDYQLYYDDETKKIVASRFKTDIDYFEYTF